MKKVMCMIALAAISFGSVHAVVPVKMQQDTMKKKPMKKKMMKKKKMAKDTTMKM